MAGLVNIGEDNQNDGFYRYKMPKLQTKIEGRGNGIKTNVVNMVDVAKALARPPSYTTKFFGCVLGAQSKFDEKTGTSTVNGAHDTSKLVQLLEAFIKKYVQCYGCGNPETEIVITKTQMITLKCAACGFLSDVDMRDKLTTFILNNPPEQKKAKGAKLRRAEKERLKAGETADEEAKSSKKPSKTKGEESAKKPPRRKDDKEKAPSPDASQKDDDEVADDDDVEWQTDTSAAAAEQRRLEQLSAATSEMVMLHVDEHQNGSAKNKSGRKGGDDDEPASPPASLTRGSARSSVEDQQEDEEDEDEEEEEEELSELEKLVFELKDYAKTHNLAEIAACVQSKGKASQILVAALFLALFDGVGRGLSKEVDKKKTLLKKVLPDEDAQLRFLEALELYCGVTKPDAIKETALVLKVLYDNDIVEEDQIFTWFSRKSGIAELGIDAKAVASVRKEAAPLVKWLQEAEAESEEE